ncbi:leucine-rich repeat and immunoglobulin-like domain-containing nogo receptor-interacting protein 3 [Stegodyphus dumicola]|uniref:leucine-rich repeat and immunoglobulin-like domain-containing nogo receptor-interacting protein 3 n=1 Tax=Stegodyphus dumicola TaxID=202533 RepID=UPI0015B28AEE|nr:leucine-rich repeat and immunoglobulin-like domain-containing nogo receptor-interacting protein 3 [Stegodyphus dumicola]
MRLSWTVIWGSLICWTILLVAPCSGACDWPPLFDDLQLRCVCGTGGNLRLTVQCGSVQLPRLVEALQSKPPLDLLAVINGTITSLEDGSFTGLDVRTIQLSSVGLSEISPLAFQGLERTLSSLNLEQNELREIPSQSIKRLTNLKELDLSRNRITEIPDAAFNGLTLTTLKLADNPLTISDAAFKGLESTLHNLNLKGTGQVKLPTAVKQLSELSFLDLSQNKFSVMLPDDFQNLRQLTALTLERNMVSSVDPRAFAGLNGTLSSLSLLNNKIEEFPTDAIRPLIQLRVLDMGFNRMRNIPEDAFIGNQLLTLLALDGNPLSTLPEAAFLHLNSTLRGLSVGGSTLVCDCRVRWIVEWVQKYDLQVTSRERNPQFCGRPTNFRRRILPQMSPTEFKCDNEFSSSSTVVTSLPTTITSQTQLPSQRPTVAASGRDLRAPRTSSLEQLRLTEVIRRGTELTVKWEGYKEDNIVRARSATPVHAMYRVFGESHFQLGGTANPTSGWIQFLVPESKPVVVCVVDTAQAATLSANSVPRNQCNEVVAEKVSDSQLNKIIIGSSAAVCGMIIIAVIIFVCCSRRSGKKQPVPRPVMKSEHEWETSSLYSGRSIPRARAYHGSVNPSYLHDPRTPDDVQSFRSLPPARAHRGGHMMGNRDMHNSQIALSQLSGHHSFLGTYGGEPHHNGWSQHHWDNGDAYSERHAPSRLSYGKDNFS